MWNQRFNIVIYYLLPLYLATKPFAPCVISHHHLLLAPHQLQQCHTWCCPPHLYKPTSQPTATSTTPAEDCKNARGSNEEQEQPAHWGQRMRKRDMAPPYMVQASLHDAADHPNSILHRKWWWSNTSDSAHVMLNPAPGWGSSYIVIATFVGLWRTFFLQKAGQAATTEHAPTGGSSSSNDSPTSEWQPRQQQKQTQKATYQCWNHTQPQLGNVMGL